MKTKTLIKTIFKNQPPERLLIRVDGGAVKGLSFGHLSRCLIFAEVIKKLYHTEILFLMADYPEGIYFARQRGMDVLTLPVESGNTIGWGTWMTLTRDFRPGWTIVDLPYNGPWQTICREIHGMESKLLFIDDTRFINIEADIILNSSVLASEKIKYRHPETTYMLGPKYFFIDPPDVKHPKKDILRVLISFGGSDPSALTLKTVQTLKSIKKKIAFELTVILGPGYKHGNPRDYIELNSETFFKTIDAPEDIYPYFLGSDLVICAGGRTLYELIALEVPALPIASIEHEKPVIKKCTEDDLVVTGLLSWNDENFIEAFRKHFERHTRVRHE